MPLVNNKEARGINLAGIVLLAPGINSVGDDLWKQATEHEMVRKLIDAGTLEVVKKAEDGAAVNAATDPGGMPPSAPDDINAMGPADAQRIIGQTYDRTLLLSWSGSTKNKDVKTALDAQLKAVGLTEEEVASANKKRR